MTRRDLYVVRARHEASNGWVETVLDDELESSSLVRVSVRVGYRDRTDGIEILNLFGDVDDCWANGTADPPKENAF